MSQQQANPNRRNYALHQLPTPAQQPAPAQPPGSQPGPLPITNPRVTNRSGASWICFRDFGRAGAFWAAIAVVTSFIFSMLQYFKPDTYDPSTVAILKEQRFQSDIAAREFCLRLREAKLAWSQSDCDRILNAPFPSRPEPPSESGQLPQFTAKLRTLLATVITALWNGVANLPADVLISCVLVLAVIFVLSERKRPQAPTVQVPEDRGHQTAQGDGTGRLSSFGSVSPSKMVVGPAPPRAVSPSHDSRAVPVKPPVVDGNSELPGGTDTISQVNTDRGQLPDEETSPRTPEEQDMGVSHNHTEISVLGAGWMLKAQSSPAAPQEPSDSRTSSTAVINKMEAATSPESRPTPTTPLSSTCTTPDWSESSRERFRRPGSNSDCWTAVELWDCCQCGHQNSAASSPICLMCDHPRCSSCRVEPNKLNGSLAGGHSSASGHSSVHTSTGYGGTKRR
ncbi:hypothetical protein QBC47DRAFT_395728 [Echria macrotheca]|uniref:Uncharacterized protein n=1 Tax=Echria macrotheca TaxID=438768 RepID=A0AAJ0B0M0_9PEZI|nr:hypothetical protein QBC47DRAFT_395728 [Echria macrotheca]